MPLVSKTFSQIITFTRASTATYFDATGTLQSAAIDTPRLDYNPATLAAQGLLIEEARTNSIRNNTMVGAVAGTPGTLPTNWVYFTPTTGLTASIVSVGVESGINYIDIRLNGTAGSIAGSEIGIDFGSALTGQVWTASTFWRVVAGSTSGFTTFRIGLIEQTSGGAFVSGAFYNQTFPTSAALSSQRPSATRQLSGGATVARVFTNFNFEPTNGAAIDITLRIGLPQLEQGAFATSVIPTTTTALTRSADVASVNTLSPWYNATAGTLYAEGVPNSPTGNAFNQVITSLDDTTNDNRIQIFRNSSSGIPGALTATAGVNQYAPSLGTWGQGVIAKVALAYQLNNNMFSVNGVNDAGGTGTIPTVTRLRIGARADGGIIWNGYLRRITYYPRRLSNAELQAITA